MNEELREAIFYINKQINCFWVENPQKTNIKFIKNYDENYFKFIAENSFQNLNTEDKLSESDLYLSIQLRNTYSHILESLFALLCSVIQAPHFVPGWILNYKNYELYQMVEDIQNEKKVINHLKIKNISWNSVLGKIFLINNKDEIVNKYSAFCERLAADFINNALKDEYNSIKHGFRISKGGFTTSFKTNNEDTEFQKLGSSNFGSQFYTVKKNPNVPYYYSLDLMNNNWPIERYYRDIIMIVLLMKNIKSFLLLYNKADEKAKYSVPNDLSALDFYKKDNPTVLNFKVSQNFEFQEVLSEHELKEIYHGNYIR